MYKTDLKLKYFMYDNDLISHLENKDSFKSIEESLDLSEEKFRIEMLEVFSVTDICDEKINTIINEIYEKFKTDENMIAILKKMATSFFSEDAELGLMVGFSYNYFYLMHPCICDLLKDGKISEENFNLLKKSVDKNIK
jgi:hypothetical protein